MSRFNLFLPLDGHNYILFNTFSRALIELEGDFKQRLDHFSTDKFTDREIEDLLEYDIVCKKETDETKKVFLSYEEEKNDTEVLNIDVLMTLQCNFNCSYCYQKYLPVRPRMGEKEAEGSVKWIINKRRELGSRKLNLHLFGGEPLLEKKKALSICKAIHANSKREDFEFTVSLTTNGSLLSEPFLRDLSGCGLCDIKITIDGSRETHDIRRPLRGGGGTFERIMKNITRFSDGYPVWISVNFDDQLYPRIPQFLTELKLLGLEKKIRSIDFKPIMSSENNSIINPDHAGVVSITAKSARKIIAIKRRAKKMGFPVRMYEPQAAPCGVFLKSHHAISPDGSIFPCSGFVGKEGFAVGHIEDSRVEDRIFMEQNPWADCPDRDCMFMPLCNGGCRSSVHAVQGSWQKTNCDRGYLEKAIPYYVREIYDSS